LSTESEETEYITERKRAEEELRSARERLDYVITYNPAVIFTGKPRADYSAPMKEEKRLTFNSRANRKH
jgi:hypothetical protein